MEIWVEIDETVHDMAGTSMESVDRRERRLTEEANIATIQGTM